MNELDKIYKKLESLEALYGYTGVVIAIFMLIIGFLAWKYLTSYAENYAKSFFNQSLAKFQADLVDNIGQKFITQRGEIEKEITGLKGNIEKEISHIQSDLNLITGQKATFLNLKREALIKYYSNYLHWLNTILEISPNNIDDSNIELARIYLERLEEAKLRHDLSEGKLELFLQKDDFFKLKGNLNVDTVRLKNNKESYIVKIKGHYQSLQLAKNQGEKFPKIASDLSKAIYDSIARDSKFHREKEVELYKDLRNKQLELRNKVSEYLNSIIEEIKKE